MKTNSVLILNHSIEGQFYFLLSNEKTTKDRKRFHQSESFSNVTFFLKLGYVREAVQVIGSSLDIKAVKYFLSANSFLKAVYLNWFKGCVNNSKRRIGSSLIFFGSSRVRAHQKFQEPKIFNYILKQFRDT